MEFRTEVTTGKAPFQISHNDSVLFIGSCFAENVGVRLQALKFPIDLNPFGVIFNPSSVANCLGKLINPIPYSDEDLFFENHCWNSFDHHSRFSSSDEAQCLENINYQLQQSSTFLKTCKVLVITFGTAWVFENIESGKIVANCHKLPANQFNRFLLSVDDIVKQYEVLFGNLKILNPALKIILTVSPVRHLKDGAEGNQVSKAILRLAAHQLAEKGLVTYFPAYEIVLDDLRDYRFFDTDMVHPSQTAIDYVFEKFANSFFSAETIKINKEIADIVTAAKHRPNILISPALKDFASKMLSKIDKLLVENPTLDFSSEKAVFQSFIN